MKDSTLDILSDIHKMMLDNACEKDRKNEYGELLLIINRLTNRIIELESKLYKFEVQDKFNQINNKYK